MPCTFASVIVTFVQRKFYRLSNRFITHLAQPYQAVSSDCIVIPSDPNCSVCLRLFVVFHVPLSLSLSLYLYLFPYPTTTTHTHTEVDTKQQHYLLLFRGILFAFPIWSLTETTNLHMISESLDLSELESQRSLVLSRVCIFSGNDPTEARFVSKTSMANTCTYTCTYA